MVLSLSVNEPLPEIIISVNKDKVWSGFFGLLALKHTENDKFLWLILHNKPKRPPCCVYVNRVFRSRHAKLGLLRPF